MASVDNPAVRKLLNLPSIKTRWGDFQKLYTSSIEKGLTYITVKLLDKDTKKLYNGKIRIQSVIAKKVKDALDEVYSKYPSYVPYCSGSYNPRAMNNDTEKKKPELDRQTSNHSVGFAIDFNAGVNGQKPSTRSNPDSFLEMRTHKHPVVAAFLKRGFSWGGDWSGNKYDPMHFEYTSDDFDSDIIVDVDSINTSDNDSSYNFSNTNTSSTYVSSTPAASQIATLSSNIENVSNTVYQLGSPNQERNDVLKIDNARKENFKSMREKLKDNSLGMGRPIVESQEMYNSSVLKLGQAAKQFRPTKQPSSTGGQTDVISNDAKYASS